MSMKKQITRRFVNVNNTRLAVGIAKFCDDIIANFDIIWDRERERDAILEIIESHLDEYIDQNLIEQYDVMCDARNNTLRNVQDGTTHLTIKFRQTNCLNLTKIIYVIQR